MSTPKVLYVSNFLDGTGWSHAAIGYALALDAADIEVSLKNVKLNNVQGEVPERIRELLNKSGRGTDVCIQQVLPPFLSRHGSFAKNIALYFVETSNFRYSGWQNYINTMDEAWVCCDHNRQTSADSGVKIPIKVIPIPMDTAKFQESHEILPFKEAFADKFIFYTIGDFNRRKNLAAIIKAFHIEFGVSEPVELLIKTTCQPSEIQTLCNEVKSHLYLYPSIEDYKKELLITDMWPDQTVDALHNTCDAFVCASYGEAWSIPTAEAMGFGKQVIAPRHSGFTDYLNDNNSLLIDSHSEPVFGMRQGIPNLYTSWENWNAVDVNQLREKMRIAYEDGDSRNAERRKQGIRRAYDFSHEVIGQKIKGLLDGISS